MLKKISIAACALTTCAIIAAILVVEQTRVPPDAILSSVNRDTTLLDRAWSQPVAASFGGTVTEQSNASMCGPASVANVMRSLKRSDASEGLVLRGTGLCSLGICFMGLTLDELANATRNNSDRPVTVLRDLSIEQFREHMRMSNDPRRRYIVNFSRAAIFGAGAGHHSPIGGYLENVDMVFVLDVNAKYQAWLIETDRLFQAVNTFDGKRKRGLLLIEAGEPTAVPSVGQ